MILCSSKSSLFLLGTRSANLWHASTSSREWNICQATLQENISAHIDMFCRQEWPYKIIDDGIILVRMQISRSVRLDWSRTWMKPQIGVIQWLVYVALKKMTIILYFKNMDRINFSNKLFGSTMEELYLRILVIFCILFLKYWIDIDNPCQFSIT